jgi:hypothetical protein
MYVAAPEHNEPYGEEVGQRSLRSTGPHIPRRTRNDICEQG